MHSTLGISHRWSDSFFLEQVIHLQNVCHFPDSEERLVCHAPAIAGLTCLNCVHFDGP